MTTPALDVLPELAREVFLSRYGAPTRAQALAWPAIAGGRHALIVAPTGSGKTLAAFFAYLAELVCRPREEDEARLIAYVRDRIAEKTGRRPRGWMGPWMSQSHATPDLLKEAGFDFLMDWPCDDQPIWLEYNAAVDTWLCSSAVEDRYLPHECRG